MAISPGLETSVHRRKSPPSRRDLFLNRKSRDGVIVSRIVTKSGRKERLLLPFGKPPCDKRPSMAGGRQIKIVWPQGGDAGPVDRREHEAQSVRLLGMIEADRVAIVGWVWF